MRPVGGKVKGGQQQSSLMRVCIRGTERLLRTLD